MIMHTVNHERLAPPTLDCGTWQNGMQINADKLEAVIVGTSPQLKEMSPVIVADVDLPVAEQIHRGSCETVDAGSPC